MARETRSVMLRRLAKEMDREYERLANWKKRRNGTRLHERDQDQQRIWGRMDALAVWACVLRGEADKAEAGG